MCSFNKFIEAQIENSTTYQSFTLLGAFSFFVLKTVFIYFWRGGKEKDSNVWLPLTRYQLGTWPATLACSLLGSEQAILSFAGRHSIH